MPTRILAFAENLHSPSDNNSCHTNYYLEDDESFPPLSATTAKDAYEMVKDDVVFSEGSTVWVNLKSYAQVAESGGVVHEPIEVFEAAVPVTTAPVRPRPASELNYDCGEEDIDDLYYQQKSLSYRKAHADQVAYARQLKTAELTYHRDLRKILEKLPDYAADTAQDYMEPIRDAEELLEGFRKILVYVSPPHFNPRSRPDWYFDGTVDDCHAEMRRRVLQAYPKDVGVERAWKEMEQWFVMPRRAHERTQIHKYTWNAYHHDMHQLLKYTLISDLENYIQQLDLHRNKTRKQRLWLIRNAIPSKQYLHPQASRINYAACILKEC
ncbi:hypothetical protein BDB00DRAFT_828930, partial [Zychaea mexicana]|uniref:uncharacterized protein n=1 Tax=Zychaea mexicana TaxID=64656 RepID=UPI0022FF18DB